jgi:hypothetical protein
MTVYPLIYSLLIVRRCDGALVRNVPGYGSSTTEGAYDIAEQGCKSANEIFPTARSFYGHTCHWNQVLHNKPLPLLWPIVSAFRYDLT